MGTREKNSPLLAWHFTYVVKKFITIQDSGYMTVGWSVFWGKIVLLFLLLFFSQLQKVTRKKQQLDQKLLSYQQRGGQGKLEKKRERERNRERRKQRERESEINSPVWDTIKKSTPTLFVSLSLLSLSLPFSSLHSLSLNINIHPRIHPRKNHKIPRKTRA